MTRTSLLVEWSIHGVGNLGTKCSLADFNAHRGRHPCENWRTLRGQCSALEGRFANRWTRSPRASSSQLEPFSNVHSSSELSTTGEQLPRVRYHTGGSDEEVAKPAEHNSRLVRRLSPWVFFLSCSKQHTTSQKYSSRGGTPHAR